MTTEERRKPAVGVQIKRWRTERGLTLANVAERSGLNVGYLSQIENDKASPSLACLASIADALEVPAAWFLIDDVPAPLVVRAASARSRDRDGPRSSTSMGGRRATSRSSRSRRPASAAASARTPMPARSITSSCAGGSG